MKNQLNLLDLDRQGMENWIQSLGGQAFHGRNLFKWIHKQGVIDFEQMSDLSKSLRARLAEQCCIELPKMIAQNPAADGTIKWVLQLKDGQCIETVYIPDGHRHTVCVSSQVGCALDCSFCSTAQQGFNRNLSTGEIIAQVWWVSRYLGQAPTNIVLMGMGEPLANFAAVVKAMHIMQDDLAYMVSKYRVTLSTSGIVPNIYRLRECCDISLAVSLHAPTDELRNQLVPINIKYPLRELIPACRAFIAGQKRRKITWEYVMLAGINDQIHHAKSLIRLLSGIPSKLNLIPFNPFPNTNYRSSSPDQIESFRQRLLKSGLIATVRKTRGDDIAAACGQLVGKVNDKRRKA